MKNKKRIQLDIEKLKNDMGINDFSMIENFKIYKSYFPELSYKRFCIYEKNGMLGRLWRGQRIDLPKENIHIKENWWRNEIFRNNNINVPVVMSSTKQVGGSVLINDVSRLRLGV